MISSRDNLTRRSFLNKTVYGFFGGLATMTVVKAAQASRQAAEVASSKLGLTHGDSRADNVCKALRLIEPQIREGLARKKFVVIKPNMVVVNKQLAATDADCIEGILEFLKPLFKGEILVAESPANGPAVEGYSNYKYLNLKSRYNVRFIDLDEESVCIQHVVNERFHPVPLRFSRYLMNPDVYVISAAVLKTHDRAITTLGLKNIAVGAILKDGGFRWGAGSKGKSDKWLVHGGAKNEGIHFNLFGLAKKLRPDLSVLDGFEGMEGNGPCSGTPVQHRVALASTDWLAADCAGAHLMGFDPHKIGYLEFCGRAGMGQMDLSKVEVLGERISDHVRRYRPHDSIEVQYKWM